MIHHRHAAFAGAIAALCAGSAFAQSVPTDWSGPYVGVVAGRSDGDLDITDAPLNTAAGSGFWGAYGGTAANSAPKVNTTGGELGGTAGWNWQSGNIVFGVEADAQASGADGNFVGFDRPAAGTDQFDTYLTSKIEYQGTLRARVGYSVGPVLVYATGGGAAVKAEFTRAYGNAAGATLSDSDSQTFTGWSYGGGAEVALSPNWSMKAEYLRLDTSEETFDTTYADGTTASATGELDRDLVRAGVNYRF